MTTGKPPVHEIRLGRIKAAIWEHQLPPNDQFPTAGIRHQVTLSRLYKDGERWRTSESFGRDDLPVVAKVVDQAHTWIFEKAMHKGATPPDMAGQSVSQ